MGDAGDEESVVVNSAVTKDDCKCVDHSSNCDGSEGDCNASNSPGGNEGVSGGTAVDGDISACPVDDGSGSAGN